MVLASPAARLEFHDSTAGRGAGHGAPANRSEIAVAALPDNEPIEVSLPVNEDAAAALLNDPEAADKAKCAYLDTKDKVWKTNGCEKSSAAAGKITCACKHLTVRPRCARLPPSSTAQSALRDVRACR
jgi:hypothetical protein